MVVAVCSCRVFSIHPAKSSEVKLSCLFVDKEVSFRCPGVKVSLCKQVYLIGVLVEEED